MEQLAILAKVSTVRSYLIAISISFLFLLHHFFSLLFTRSRLFVFLIPSTSSLFLVPLRHSPISNLHTSSHFVSFHITSYSVLWALIEVVGDGIGVGVDDVDNNDDDVDHDDDNNDDDAADDNDNDKNENEKKNKNDGDNKFNGNIDKE